MNVTPGARRARLFETIFGDSPRAIASTIGIIVILAIVAVALIADTGETDASASEGLAAPWQTTSEPVDTSRYTHTPFLVPEAARYISNQVRIGGGDGDITGFTFVAKDRVDLKPLLITLYREGQDADALDDTDHPEPHRLTIPVKPGTYQAVAWYDATGDWSTDVQRITTVNTAAD